MPMARHRLLTAAEERELAIRVRAGDAEARHELSSQNLALCRRIARDYAPYPVQDAYGDACCGLMLAVDRYDPDRGVRFGTFAGWWIRQAIGRAIAETARPIRVPTGLAGRARKAPAPDPGRPPRTRPERTLAAARSVLAAGWQGGEALGSVSARRSDDDARDLPDWTPAEARLEAHRLLSVLDDRSRAIVCRRFGIGGEPATLAEVGESWSLSKERVRLIEAEALAVMRAAAGVAHAG